MAGSLLDLADELGEAESPSTGQNRRMVDGEHMGTTATTNAAVQLQAVDRNGGRFMQESPRIADRQVGYHSYTLPHSFSSGGRHGGYVGGGRSPRMHHDGGGSEGDGGPPKPPRTDYPHKGEYDSKGAMQGNSPFLPGSSFTTGRQHQKKRNLVRNWVQDQQLRCVCTPCTCACLYPLWLLFFCKY